MPDTNIDLPSDWAAESAERMKRYREERDEARANIPTRVEAYLDAHPAIEQVIAEYDGSGDGGAIEGWNVIPESAGENLDTEQLEDMLWRVAYDTHPGFEISDGVVDGAFGTIIITRSHDGGPGSIVVEHHTRIESTEDDLVEYALR